MYSPPFLTLKDGWCASLGKGDPPDIGWPEATQDNYDNKEVITGGSEHNTSAVVPTYNDNEGMDDGKSDSDDDNNDVLKDPGGGHHGPRRFGEWACM